jgi:hypothetical protein
MQSMSSVIAFYISLFSVTFVTNVGQNNRNIPVQVKVFRKFHD